MLNSRYYIPRSLLQQAAAVNDSGSQMAVGKHSLEKPGCAEHSAWSGSWKLLLAQQEAAG